MPKEIDAEIARLKLEQHGVGIDTLTDEQRRYLDILGRGHLRRRDRPPTVLEP